MRLPKTVLDVVRGAGGAAMALAIGCSSSHGGEIRGEPAARLSPVVALAPAIVVAPAQTVVPLPVAPLPLATLDPVTPPSPPAATPPVAPPPRRHHRRVLQPIGGIGNPPDIDPMVMANCGRG